jgi:PAS domain S-box-containing protein
VGWLTRWLPRSLVGRVFALYSVTLLAFVGGGLALFYQFQFSVELEDAQTRAEALAAVIQPTVSDSAVIGDDDTIARTLERAISHSSFAAAAFIDLKGHQVRAERKEPLALEPPAWLTNLVASRLYDTNLPITVGGRDYGVLRLTFAPALIAGDLWRMARGALALGALSLVGGLLLIRFPLVHWLGHLGRLRTLEAGLQSGDAARRDLLDDSAPIEFRQTFAVLNQAAESLQAQREQAAVTLGAIGDAVLTLDAAGRVLLANPAAAALFGQPAEQLRGQAVQGLLPDAFSDAPAATGEVPPAWQPWRGRRAQLGAGEVARTLDTTLSTIQAADGRTAGLVLACHDVTEAHRLDQRLRNELATREAALRTLRGVLDGLSSGATLPALLDGTAVSHRAPAGSGGEDDIEAISLGISGLVASLQERSEQLQAIFALSPDGFVSFDARRCVSYANPAFVRLTGLDATALLGLDEAAFASRLAGLCSETGRAQMPGFDALRQAAADETGSARRALIHTDRPARRVLLAGLRQSRVAAISQVFYLRDVTHETEVDQMKTEFLSTAAHELRTPMASIFGFCELLLHRSHSPERQREMLQVVQRQSQRMVAILNELLDLARIESRRGTDFSLETLDLAVLVRDVVAEFKPPADRPGPQLDGLQAGVLVRVDRNKMHQALGNVLSNAYKYSPAGGSVRLQLLAGSRADQPGVGGDPDQQPWGVQVIDSGIGMTPEQLARVSERFYRADTSGNIPGTGLGMSIVKEIVELLGGRLQMDSQLGQGSQVTLWLPGRAQ